MSTDQVNIDFLEEKYNHARLKYKPRDIKTLIIGEAPPCNLDRFFYFEDAKKQDSLFLEIMGVLYPRDKENYLKSKRETFRKEQLLNQFMEDGYWLIDLAEVPPEVTNIPYEEYLPSLLDRLGKIIDKQVPIILIKSNVYDICYSALANNGYTVINERIPFPGSGQQGVFREKFKKLLQ